MAEIGFKQVERQEVQITPPPEVELKIRQGKKFILVDDSYDPEAVPDGFSLVEHSHRGKIFKAIIPHSVLYHMGNKPGGDPKQALKELSDFCREGEEYEDKGNISPQGINWINRGGDRYVARLTTLLTYAKKVDGREEIGFTNELVKHLMFDDPYVEQRMKAIAALALGVNINELQRTQDLSQIAVHVTNIPSAEETLIPHFVRCDHGSSIELKAQYAVKRVVRTTAVETIDLNMARHEKEIHDHISASAPLDPQDCNLIRQRINLEYIASKNPKALLPMIMQ